MIDVSALQDQWQAQQRDYAELCMKAFDAYVTAGFKRREAMQLLHRYLDVLEDHIAKTD